PLVTKMRASLITTCSRLLSHLSPHAKAAIQACRHPKDDAERPKCYDRLDTSASTAPRGQRDSRPEAETGWVVNDEKSPLDDSPLVSAALASPDGKAALLMRCKDRKTEVAVSIRGFINCKPGVRVTYRVDQAQATEAPWNAHSSCYLALAPSPI